ncbi:MAG: hypothetical protein A3J74_04525 [Elusimicrobia bacterium RIFCSPHIGHO2_02_FULL_57_9]|nr:MAG: hypothetical protein A3J74_04525 [Elusimicrobia bacterium RIFCSPHIGHO2_02_FULL_57_9]
MSWQWNPFKKKENPAAAPETAKNPSPFAAAQAIPKELETPAAKGVMGLFYRKWKDPAFVKQMKVIAAHMAKEGINVKDTGAVKAWLEKNKEALEAGKFAQAPEEGVKQGTYVKTRPDIGRNDPCTCGSGKKYKKCCGTKA